MQVLKRIRFLALALVIVAGVALAAQQLSDDTYLVTMEVTWTPAEDVTVSARFTVGAVNDHITEADGHISREYTAHAGDIATISAETSRRNYGLVGKITQKTGHGGWGAPKRRTGWGSVFVEKTIH